MTEENYRPGQRFASGVKLDPAPVFVDGVAGAKLREVEALPKPAPSQAVGVTLSVTPISVGRPWSSSELAEMAATGGDDKPETIVQADDEQRAYRKRVSDKLARAHRVNEGLRQHNREIVGIVASLEERLADATVRAYEPPDTLPGVVGAAVEGLLATGKRWWRG